MKGTMKVAVMNGIGQMGFIERPIPQPADNEVLVKLEYVGICGSDMHYYETGRIGDYIVKPPFVLGHEPGGTVVEVGKGVKHLKVGDRVALEPGKTCGHCEFCREGKYNLCSDVRSEEHTSELQSRQYLVCRLLLEKKKKLQTKQLSKIHFKISS